MNPNLDLVFGFRAMIFLSRGDESSARVAASHALELNEFSDVAMEVMDRLG